MERSHLPPHVQLVSLMNGFEVTQALRVAVALGIADELAEGPRGSDDLAAAVGADPDALYRLLRALASVGVFAEEDGRQFALNDLGAGLRTGTDDSVAGWLAFYAEPYRWQVWQELEHSVRTGGDAFRHVHGVDAWTYRAGHPEVSARFDRGMAALSRHVVRGVLAACDFGRFATIMDAGGGNGALLAAILTRYPAARGILFDQPHVVSAALPVLSGAGVASRCEVVGGSFFDDTPPRADACILKSILHDWGDTDCHRILAWCRRALAPGATLLVVERDLDNPGTRSDNTFSDLNMLVSLGGRERTATEYAALFASTGFQIADVTPTASVMAIFEATAI